MKEEIEGIEKKFDELKAQAIENKEVEVLREELHRVHEENKELRYHYADNYQQMLD